MAATIPDIHVCFTSVDGYDIPRNILLASMPVEMKANYIVIYQKKTETVVKKCEDGHYEVHIPNNIYEYGNWIGAHMLQEAGLISKNAWFFFVHDTCKFGAKTQHLVTEIIRTINHNPTEIMWITRNGQFNFCLSRGSAIRKGWEKYKDLLTVDKYDAVKGELERGFWLSAKGIEAPQKFHNLWINLMGKRKVYSEVERDVGYLPAVDIEKYFYWLSPDGIHPQAP